MILSDAVLHVVMLPTAGDQDSVVFVDVSGAARENAKKTLGRRFRCMMIYGRCGLLDLVRCEAYVCRFNVIAQ
jgi:hypothetical protein